MRYIGCRFLHTDKSYKIIKYNKELRGSDNNPLKRNQEHPNLKYILAALSTLRRFLIYFKTTKKKTSQC